MWVQTATPLAPESKPYLPLSERLVVVDDPVQAESLAAMLRQEGYLVDVASTGQDALAVVRDQPAPAAVLLAVALPDLNGIEVTRRLRASSNVPIIMLTALRHESDKITGLDAGANDYVTKPFSQGELLARIRVQVRHRRQKAGLHGTFTVGGLLLDAGARRVSRDGETIALSAREFDILQVLAESAGRVVRRPYLFARIWGADFFGDERALDVYVSMIRKKIEPDPHHPTYLHTVRGVGYRLAAEGRD